MTSEILGHFRDLMLAKSAPGQAGVLDVSDDEAERLRAQAAKFSPGRAGAGHRVAPRRPDRHAVDHVPPADPRARIGPGHHPRDGRPAPRAHLARSSGWSGVGRDPGTAGDPRSRRGRRHRPTSPELATASAQDAAASQARRFATGPPAAPQEPAPPLRRRRDVERRRRSPRPVPVLRARDGGDRRVEPSARRGARSSSTCGPGQGGAPVVPGGGHTGGVRRGDVGARVPARPRFGVTKVEERETELRARAAGAVRHRARIRCVVREAVAGSCVDEDPPLPEEEALARLTSRARRRAPRPEVGRRCTRGRSRTSSTSCRGSPGSGRSPRSAWRSIWSRRPRRMPSGCPRRCSRRRSGSSSAGVRQRGGG